MQTQADIRLRATKHLRDCAAVEVLPNRQEQDLAVHLGESCECDLDGVSMSSSDASGGDCGSVASQSTTATCLRARLRSFSSVFRATAISHGNALTGTSSSRRQATRKASAATSSALSGPRLHTYRRTVSKCRS